MISILFPLRVSHFYYALGLCTTAAVGVYFIAKGILELREVLRNGEGYNNYRADLIWKREQDEQAKRESIPK